FFTWMAAGLVVVVTTAWILGLWEAVRANDKEPQAPTPGQAVRSALLDPRSKATAYLSASDVSFVDVLRGRSGKLKAAFKTPGEAVVDEPEEEATLHYEAETGGSDAVSPDFKAPEQPGVYRLAVELNKAQREIE